MELFRKAAVIETGPNETDWTVQHGYAESSRFPFPDLYLDEDTAALLRTDPAFAPFLEDCLRRFTAHDYGHLSSLDLVENFLNRDIHRANTWMRGNWPSERWGEVQLEVFYDLGLFHRGQTPPRDLALEQSRKERAEKAAQL